jgi:hypothetical protein
MMVYPGRWTAFSAWMAMRISSNSARTQAGVPLDQLARALGEPEQADDE